jgi:hypothetical protein
MGLGGTQVPRGPGTATPGREEGTDGKTRVLVIDDDEDFRAGGREP